MPPDFDRIVNRRNTNSVKWTHYQPEVLPLWVADMDFSAPEPILAALRRMVDHGILGYEMITRRLAEVVAARMEKLYGWKISPEMVVATPGVVSGFNAAARTVCPPGAAILVQPPVYPPFLTVQESVGARRVFAGLVQVNHGARLHYEIDWEGFEKTILSADLQRGMFLLCAPHNPTGQIYDRMELTRMAELCLKNHLTICSDEIHSELLLHGARHIPIASLSPEVAEHTITLVSPSKTFNIPGLFCGFAIIPNAELLARYRKTVEQLTLHVNSLGLAAAEAAFSGSCDDWLARLCSYLTENRKFLIDYIETRLHGIRTTVPDATYLAWLDCNDLIREGRIMGSAQKFFLENARVGLNEGADFGPGGEGFVRLNFGCPRATLVEALDKIEAALSRAQEG